MARHSCCCRVSAELKITTHDFRCEKQLRHEDISSGSDKQPSPVGLMVTLMRRSTSGFEPEVDGIRTRNIQVNNPVPYHWATTAMLPCSETVHGTRPTNFSRRANAPPEMPASVKPERDTGENRTHCKLGCSQPPDHRASVSLSVES